MFADGPARRRAPPLIAHRLPATLASYADPLPQALVLTAIVISFAMTAVLLALGAAQPRAETAPTTWTARTGMSRARHACRCSAAAPSCCRCCCWRVLQRRRTWPRLVRAARSVLARSSLAALALALLRAGRRRHGARLPRSATGRRPSASRWSLDRLAALMLLRSPPLVALASLLLRAAAGRATTGAASSTPCSSSSSRPQRRLPDRRPVQPVRLLRGAADRLLRAAAARPRAASALTRRPALRGAQPARLGAVPDGARPALRRARHAEHGGPGACAWLPRRSTDRALVAGRRRCCCWSSSP